MRRLARFFARACAALALCVANAYAASPNVVINQVYGGGGNTGAAYQNDFVELFNRGTSAVNLAGMSVQYASATGTGNFGASATQLVALPAATLQPGQSFLIKLASGGTAGSLLPTADVDGTINMSATAGKVALVNSTTTLGCNGGSTPCSAAQLALIVDLVGYGAANFFEGPGPAPAASNTNSILRSTGGCVDTDSNASDFSLAMPNPRNSGAPLAPCGGTIDAPIAASCPATLGTVAGTPASAQVSATDPDDLVQSATIVSAAVPGVSLGSIIPATATNAPLTATLAVAATTAVGTYPVTVLFGNGDPTPQTMTCLISVSVTASAITTRIRDIQGRAHRSPLVGQTVANVPGIVTATRSNGFYFQDPSPDADPATSEGIFVFTNSAPVVQIGDDVRVGGTVTEFRPGGASGATNLTITEITSPTVAIVNSGNPLPAPVIIGNGGRVPPATVIEDDATGNVETSGTFDPDADGLDFYESLEGMRVQVNNAVVVGPTNRFGETPLLGDGGANAGLRTTRGGIVISASDFNPERIIADDEILPSGGIRANVGDTVPVIVGVMDYSFGNYKLYMTQTPTVTAGGLVREVTPLVGEGERLTVASYNVENLDPTDVAAKFQALATQIVNNLKSPDIVALSEVQDNNGPTDNGVVDATVTLQTLVDAITAAGGPAYRFRQVDPVNNEDGGEPGGNIRVAFLYNPARVHFVDRPGATATTGTTVLPSPEGPVLSLSPGRIDPTNPAFSDSRKPLAGEFIFRGNRLFVIANHFNSKGGDQPLFGVAQPPARPSEVQRTQQATVVANFVTSLLAADANAHVIVLGDLNDFEFASSLAPLKGAGLIDLVENLPPEERYTYVFDGNSQVLDHILVSPGLAMSAAAEYDIVHVNAEFADQTSDHDPEVVRLTLPRPEATSRFAIQSTAFLFNRRTGQFVNSIRLTNTSGAAVNGPVRVVFDGITAGVTLANAQGTLDGKPYIEIGTVAAGATVTVNAAYANPTGGAISYVPRIYVAPF